MSDPFGTATELSQLLGLNEPTDLARFQQHLAAASALVRRFTGQELSNVTDDVVTLPAIDRTTLILPERPVVSIASVVANSVTLSPTTDYWFDAKPGLLHSGTRIVEGTFWSYGATVTYTHGYAEFSPEYEAIKAIVLEVASRTITLNERSASEALGGTIMETAGYAPETFLTRGEMWELSDFGKVGVG